MFKVFVVLRSNKKDYYSFFYKKDYTSLLNGLISHNITIESQCLSGYCGTCRLKLLKGEVKYYFEPLAFCKENEIVSCCSFPISNIVIDFEYNIT